jgi:MFS transporter, ACS family, D-galactonate transporter
MRLPFMSTGAMNLEKLSAASWRVLALLGFSVFMSFVDRGNLSIAAPLLKDELHLSASRLGLLLSVFFWSSSFSVLLMGSLIDRFIVAWILAGGFFLWSVATTATGFVHGFAALLTMRILLGIGESVAYPAYGNIFARHFPEHHRGIANGVIGASQACGPAFATYAGGMVIGRFGWRPFFIFLGLANLPWLPLWFRWRPRDTPEAAEQPAHPFAGTLEVVKQRSAWGTCVGLFSANYVAYLLLTWLPFYLVRERHFSLVATGKIAGVAFLLKAATAIASGQVSDRWISSGASPTLVRKTFLCAGSTLAGTFLVLSALTPTNASVFFLMAATFSVGLTTPHHFAASQTLAGRRMAGTWTGFQGCIGNFAGILAPAITGFILDRTGKFFWAFVITALVGWAGALSWLLLVGPLRQVVWLPSSFTNPGSGSFTERVAASPD